MIPKLATISTRPVELTAPEFTNRRRLDVTYEDIERMMEQQKHGMPERYESTPRFALIALKHLALSESGQDRVTIRKVRVLECAVCVECGGFIHIFGDSHLSEGIAERRYFHLDCYDARQAEYARLEDEGE